MANIKGFDAPALNIQPSDRAAAAHAAVGRRGGAFYNQAAQSLSTVGREIGSGVAAVGDAGVAFLDHREISAGAAHGARLLDGLTQDWNGTVSDPKLDPNDPTVAAKWRDEQLEPRLQQFSGGFNTEKSQKWAEQFVDRVRSHMFEKTAADMTSLAGIAAVSNAHTVANTLSNTAMNDPSAVPFLLGSVDHSIDGIVGSSPNLKGVDAAKLRTGIADKTKEAIVKAGAQGAIAKAADPEAVADAWITKYPAYISGAEAKTLAANARTQLRADRIDKAYADHQTKVEAEQRSDAAETGVLQKLYSDDPAEQRQVSTKAVVNNPELTRTAKERLISVVNREIKPETDAQVSNGNAIKLLSDIRAGRISDVQPIYDARVDGRLSKPDFEWLKKEFTDFRSEGGESLGKDRAEFFKRYGGAIDPTVTDPGSMTFGHFSALGNQAMYAAEKAARRAEADARTRGQDPHSVYDPSSPNFFGKPENLSRFRVSLSEATAYQARIGKAAAPPKLGEEKEGYRFKGGDPSKPESWEAVK